MLPTPKNYNIYPSVIPADKPVEISVVPAERAFIFFEGTEYTFKIYGINTDVNEYYTPFGDAEINAVAKGGVLRFTHTFEGEQEHLIHMCKGDEKVAEFNVYSLREDLYGLRPMRGDFHSHTFRSDGKRDPAALAGYFRENGYDFFALTDHNRFYPGGETDEVYEGVDTGFFRIPGEEVHTPGSTVHIVHVGGRTSVANIYIHERERYEREVAECMERVPENVPPQYHDKYARAMWATESIHNAGGLAIFPHPYWRPWDMRYNVCDELAMILLKSGMFDGYELIGGQKQTGNNRSVMLWSELRAEGLRIPVVGSSDVHGVEKSYYFPNCFTVCFARDNSAKSVTDAVRSGMTVAVHASGYEYDRYYDIYGSLRLMTYAQYLLRYYFPKQERLCEGIGVTMRAYAMGEADAAVIELQAKLAENYRARFFGEKPPVLPDATMLEFENRWREIHLKQGPMTKGSVIDSDKITRQI